MSSAGLPHDSQPLITPSDRIFVAGHRGMAGSAIARALGASGYTNLLTASRSELDLEDGNAVRAWFEAQRPEVVVLAAAKVGGIHFNDTYPADFLLDNLKIQTHVIESAWRTGTRRLLFLGSSCIYPAWQRSRSRRRFCSPGHWSPPTSGTRLPRLPASSSVPPCASNTASMRSA